MKIKLLKCFICEGWYSPHAHHVHCPYCGTCSESVGNKRITAAGNLIARVTPRAWITVGPFATVMR